MADDSGLIGPMPPEVGAGALGAVWGVVCATISLRRAPLAGVAWLALSAAAVVAAAAVAASRGTWSWRPSAAIAAAAALPAGWLLRRMVESMLEGRR
jgi:hypothetical protein